jgi:hypothetical protein
VGTSTDEIRRELDATREDLDGKIDVLEGRARSAANRVRPIAAGVLGGAVLILIGGYAIYRTRRTPSTRERIAAIVPDPVLKLRDAVELRLRRGVPSMRIYVGDRPVGEEPASSGWQKIGLRLAQSAGTAGGSALVAFALRSVTKPEKAA